MKIDSVDFCIRCNTTQIQLSIYKQHTTKEKKNASFGIARWNWRNVYCALQQTTL